MMVLPHFLAGGGEMRALMRAKSWEGTPLGPPETWHDALKMVVSICLNSRFPMVLWWGPELVMLYNDAWRPVLGKTKHPAALGRPGIEVFPEIWDIIGAQLTSVLSTGEATWSDDQLLVTERNNYREEGYFTYSYSPIKHSDGRVVGVFTAVSETTERVLGERRLRILRELAAQTAESKSVQAACQAFARVLGAGNPDLPFAILYLLDEDGTFASLLAKTGLDDTFAPAAVSLDQDDPWGVARVIRDGNMIVLNDLSLHFGDLPGGIWPEPTTSAIVLPVAKPGQNGGTAGVLVAGINPRRALDDAYRGFFDLVAGHLATAISNARAHEEERKRAEALAEIDRAKTQFFSNVSHEFRTPLTLMLGPLEDVLAKPETTPLSDHRSLVSFAHRNGVRMLKLVNALLDFSRIEAGRAQASFQPIDLAIFTAELASNFQSAIEKAGLHLVVDCPSLPQQVYVDADMWEKVVLNLISNAFKFTFEGEIAIAAKPSSDGRSAEVTVRDTGSGIPPEELSHLFERFHRVVGARGRSIEGSGIGLALVQELIKLHGGTIRVTSEVGQGSAFTVAIPFGVGHLPADRIVRGRAMATANVRPQAYVEEALGWFSDGGTAATRPPPPSASDELGDVSATAGTEGQLVLVADDNADMRNYVERLLRAGGYRVEAVTDGKKALAAAQRLKPDLVLSDVMMPELDGFGLLAAVRKDAELRDTPVLLLSARAGEEAKVEGLSAGADDYLIKPFSARELLARVSVKLRLARTRRERRERELRQILDLTPLHITEFGTDGSRLYKNQAGLDYYGLTLESWQRADLQKLCHQHDAEFLMHELPHRFASGSAFEREMRLKRRDGQYRWFLVRFRPMVDEHGRPTRWYAAATDIEDRKQAEQRLENENVALREEIDKASMFEEIVGISPALHAVLSRVSKVAPTDSTVLITGETGTGKELIARAVHKRSRRSSRAFVSVNCAAIPRDLIASELFGHEKGAFTGATQRRLGRFELAEGGTILLDEVGELPAETQIALLRVLQEHEFERVGGTGSIRTDVRVVAATNRDLEAGIAAGTFRSDLFYRLNVFPIEIPPLRERREDIPVLVEYFIDRYARKAGKSFQAVNKKSFDLLQGYSWPGNIRELQNIIERSVIVCEAENFSVDESWLSRQPRATGPRGQLELSQNLASQEKEMIEAALRESGGQVSGPSGAAAKLGLPGSTLESKIRSLKISKKRFKTTNPSADRI
ncbi:MAG TPA: sigma 54-interacting transcriptional regulator [Candidatus Polarisedimenticolia bacterium]|nr:sigma 54-interacting transcriptional regulator [Candidatus Polarisedimenticolia bacterium]